MDLTDKKALFGILCAAAAPAASPAHAQWKPARPITIIVPWAAGGSPSRCP